MSKNIAVIICAAGASSRFGSQSKLSSKDTTANSKRKKPFTDVAGRAAFLRSIEFFAERDDVKQILMAIQPEDEELVKIKWGANLDFFNVKTYFGGKERFDTVAEGLKLIKDDITLIAVHDAVRCCLTKKWIDNCFAKAAETGAAIPAAPTRTTSEIPGRANNHPPKRFAHYPARHSASAAPGAGYSRQ